MSSLVWISSLKEIKSDSKLLPVLQMFVNWFCLEVLRDKLFGCRNLENWVVFFGVTLKSFKLEGLVSILSEFSATGLENLGLEKEYEGLT